MESDLHDLLAGWLGHADLADERRDSLLARLRADEPFRQAFVAEIHMLGMVKVAQAPPPRWLRLADEMGWSAVDQLPAPTLAERVLRIARLDDRRQKRRRAWAIAATLLLALGGGLLLIYLGGHPAPAPTVPPVARVAKLDDVEWESASAAFVEGTDVPAGRLRIRSGRVTLVFHTGVSLTVEGPADLQVITVDLVYCRHGKLRAHVPFGAEGFTVRSRGYEVVDLGTEFGLNVEEEGKGRLMVFQGEAAVSLLNENGRAVRGALLEGRRAVEVDVAASRIREVPPVPEQYVDLPSLPLPSLLLATNYRDEILAANPCGYWRFQSLTNGKVSNEVANGAALHAQGPVSIAGQTHGNRWAVFKADDPRQAFLMDGAWTPPRGDGYAIELWVQSEALGQAALVSLIALRSEPEERHLAYLELTARGQRSMREPYAVRFLDRWPPALSGGVNVFSRKNAEPERWHHIVGQKTADAVELYIDGVLVSTSPASALNGELPEDTTPCWLVLGRLKQWTMPPNLNEIRPFVGRMDELAIYNRPLTSTEIAHHYNLRAAGKGE